MSKKPLTQCDRIMEFIKQNGSITHLEALRELGVMSISPRISELRQRGEPIITILTQVKNRYNQNCTIAVYKLDTEVK